MLLFCILLFGIGSRLLVNNALRLWIGQKEGHLALVVLGVAFVALGIVLGIHLWKKHYKDASAGRGRRLVRLVFSYLGIQLSAGLLVGLLGLLVFRLSGSYAGALVAVDFTTVLIQGLIRAIFLFLIVEMLLQRRFREDFSVLRKGLFLAIAFSLVSAGLFL